MFQVTLLLNLIHIFLSEFANSFPMRYQIGFAYLLQNPDFVEHLGCIHFFFHFAATIDAAAEAAFATHGVVHTCSPIFIFITSSTVPSLFILAS